MLQTVVTVINEEGLHGKPLGIITELAKSAGTSVWLEKENIRVNALSMLGVLSLNVLQREQIQIIADGPDAPEIIQKMKKAIEAGFKTE